MADLHAGEAELGLRLRLAALLSERLGRDEQAASLYELLLEEAPSERKIWQPLLVLYRRLGKEAAVEACIAKVEAEVESREDRELLRMERIRLMIGAGRLDEAERDLRETLDAEPDSAEAARVLVELLQKAGRLDELRELCTELFDQARQRADAPQVVSYGLELARLYAETPEEAASILLSGLNVASAHLDYLRTLHGLLRQVGSASDRADVLEYLARAESGTRAAEVVLELVSLRYETGDERGLGLALELGFELAPEDRRIGDRYVDHLRTQEDFGRLADILVDRAKRNQDAAEAVLALSEAAALYDQRLGDPGQAASAMLEAFARDGEDAGLLRRGVEYLVTAGQIDLALVRLDAAIGLNDEMTLGDLLDLRARILERERPSDLAALEQAAADLARALDQILPEDQEAD
ncbi:MAG TPA: tetratricopeptide repeat protein, partial [Polyangiaceae bacterium]|nr:tetratricopeptide repeat protein [Polyangiaceae bacterium]